MLGAGLGRFGGGSTVHGQIPNDDRILKCMGGSISLSFGISVHLCSSLREQVFYFWHQKRSSMYFRRSK